MILLPLAIAAFVGSGSAHSTPKTKRGIAALSSQVKRVVKDNNWNWQLCALLVWQIASRETGFDESSAILEVSAVEPEASEICMIPLAAAQINTAPEITHTFHAVDFFAKDIPDDHHKADMSGQGHSGSRGNLERIDAYPSFLVFLERWRRGWD